MNDTRTFRHFLNQWSMDKFENCLQYLFYQPHSKHALYIHSVKKVFYNVRHCVGAKDRNYKS